MQIKKHMSLLEWQNETMTELNHFVKYWQEKQKTEDKTNYPDTLWAGDWDEQFSLQRRKINEN